MSFKESFVKTDCHGSIMTIELSRPGLLNSLNLEMVREVRGALERARSTARCRCVLLLGAGDRAFCAGGDVKALAQWVKEEQFDAAHRFFEEEYALDLLIHEYPKPVLVVADGIAMGGGLGLAAGADLVIATERTRMAMPETSIGFFPDVGATGWLFSKCGGGYPEYIGLTGYEMWGEEAVRCGLATHLTVSRKIGAFLEALKSTAGSISADRHDALTFIRSGIERFCKKEIAGRPDLDAWVEAHFNEKSSMEAILDSLKSGRPGGDLCREALDILRDRSPTALAVTLTLLRRNRGRPLREVLDAELRAARFMIRHPDYLEGVRARVLEKDNRPRWRPGRIEEVKARATWS